MSFLGKIIYKFYYKGKSDRAYMQKFGGKANYLDMLQAEQEMRTYALHKLTIDSGFKPDGKFKLNFLTGDKFIHQTLFCTYSFFKFLTTEESSNFSVNYFSDGSLSGETMALLKSRFPAVRVIDTHQINDLRSTYLPKSIFPLLNKKVNTLPLFKKLIYPHLNNSGLAIFFDSDMLFMRRPVAFLNWLYQFGDDAKQAFCIQDINRSYGYTDEQILKVWPAPVKNDINSGLYAINSAQIDFKWIEAIANKFETQYGSQYYMEQLITAILLEKTGNLTVASKADYIVLPDIAQIENQTGVLHHYVNESKRLYFKQSWKNQVNAKI